MDASVLPQTITLICKSYVTRVPDVLSPLLSHLSTDQNKVVFYLHVSLLLPI